MKCLIYNLVKPKHPINPKPQQMCDNIIDACQATLSPTLINSPSLKHFNFNSFE